MADSSNYKVSAAEFGKRVMALYKSKIFPRSGAEFAADFTQSAVSAGARISSLGDLTDTESKLGVAVDAIVKLNEVNFIVQTMTEGGFYTASETRPLREYIDKLIEALRKLVDTLRRKRAAERIRAQRKAAAARSEAAKTAKTPAAVKDETPAEEKSEKEAEPEPVPAEEKTESPVQRQNDAQIIDGETFTRTSDEIYKEAKLEYLSEAEAEKPAAPAADTAEAVAQLPVAVSEMSSVTEQPAKERSVSSADISNDGFDEPYNP